jgi:hypothetical protein
MSNYLNKIIFFDLETSSLHRVGQILNYCFVVVDRSWNQIDKLSGEINLSRLELPDPAAISATSIDVIDLINRNPDNEFTALNKIHNFLKKHESTKTAIAGFNTEAFDVPYLRTSFIRNGLYPYLKFSYTDLLILCQYFISKEDSLREKYRKFLIEKTDNNDAKLSLKLEYIATFLGVLEAPQSHDSADDVEVTIKLAKLINDEFGYSIFDFNSYNLFDYHKQNGEPVYIVSHSRSWEAPFKEDLYCYLRTEGNSSYWCKLDEYSKWTKNKDKKLPIKRFKHCEAIKSPSSNTDFTSADLTLAKDAFEELKNFNVNDLYPPKKVYLEQWIYRININLLTDFSKIISNSAYAINIENNLDKDLQTLLKRYLIANSSDEILNKHLMDTFKKYALFRYNKGMVLYTDEDKPKDRPVTHLDFNELNTLASGILSELKSSNALENKIKALNSLKDYYQNAPVAQFFR